MVFFLKPRFLSFLIVFRCSFRRRKGRRTGRKGGRKGREGRKETSFRLHSLKDTHSNWPINRDSDHSKWSPGQPQPWAGVTLILGGAYSNPDPPFRGSRQRTSLPFSPRVATNPAASPLRDPSHSQTASSAVGYYFATNQLEVVRRPFINVCVGSQNQFWPFAEYTSLVLFL